MTIILLFLLYYFICRLRYKIFSWCVSKKHLILLLHEIYVARRIPEPLSQASSDSYLLVSNVTVRCYDIWICYQVCCWVTACSWIMALCNILWWKTFLVNPTDCYVVRSYFDLTVFVLAKGVFKLDLQFKDARKMCIWN